VETRSTIYHRPPTGTAPRQPQYLNQLKPPTFKLPLIHHHSRLDSSVATLSLFPSTAPCRFSVETSQSQFLLPCRVASRRRRRQTYRPTLDCRLLAHSLGPIQRRIDVDSCVRSEQCLKADQISLARSYRFLSGVSCSWSIKRPRGGTVRACTYSMSNERAVCARSHLSNHRSGFCLLLRLSIQRLGVAGDCGVV
jgi:hypothetical protein